MNKNRISKEEAIFMIVLTITMPLVFTALQPEIKNNEIVQNSSLDFFSGIIKKTISFFDLVPSASAEDFGCCIETVQGAKCVQTTQTECLSGKWNQGTNCQDICKIGCCIDSQGVCSQNAISAYCPVPPALDFKVGDTKCEQSPLCQEGCCTKGIYKFWSTNITCFGQGGVWDENVPDEVTCLEQASQEQYGCCKSYAGCEYITGLECTTKSGTFSANQACYDIPSCDCTLGSTGKCVDGYSDLYKEDSCGNVYINLPPLDSCSSRGEYCNPKTNECESGNCTNIFKNNVNGQFAPQVSTETAKNGDAWCVYDTALDLGNGTAPMGSRHWRVYCLNGVQHIDPCDDYRQEVCTEMQCVPNGNTALSGQICVSQSTESLCVSAGCLWLPNKQAYCVTNNWRNCYNITDEKQCNEDGSCFWWTDFARQQNYTLNDPSLLNILNTVTNTNWKIFVNNSYVDGQSKRNSPDVPICLPIYPPGLDDGFATTENREAICSMGSNICQYEEEWWGAGKKTNAECRTDEWRIFSAQECKSLGDCGTWVNWVGQNTTGFKILETTNASGTKVKNEIMVPQGYQDFVSEAIKGIKEPNNGGKWGGGFAKALTAIILSGIGGVGIAVGIGAILSAAAMGAGVSAFLVSASLMLPIAVGGILFIIANSLPPGPEKGALEALGAGLIGFGTAALITLAAGGPVGWVTAGIGAAVAGLYFLVYMLGYSQEFYYQQCNPSMPPTNGNDCHLCNEDPNRPCSKYRCESLGTACQYNDTIDVDIGGILKSYDIAESSCNAIQNDGLAPYITDIKVTDLQGNSYLATPSTTSGPTYISITKQDGSPIPEWTDLIVDIKLNEKAFCRYDFQSTLNISSMGFAFDSTVLRQELKQKFTVSQQLPQFLVRCADIYQNANVLEYTLKFSSMQGPDIEPPMIIGTDKDNFNKFDEGTTQLDLLIYTNKMADCRWDKEDKEYSEMSPATQCTTTLMVGGFRCLTMLTGLVKDVPNEFNIRCNSTNGVANRQSYKLTLYSTPALKIASYSPKNNDEVKGCEMQSQVTLTIDTTDGSDAGLSKCYWTYNRDYSDEKVFTTDATYIAHHEENITVKNSGTKTVYIECVDSAGSKVQIPGG